MGFSRQEYWSGVPLPSPITFIWKYKKWKLTYSDKELISVCWGKRKWREGGINMRHEETFGDGDRFIILIEVIFSQMYTCVKIHPTLCAVSVQFSWSVMSNSLWPHGLQHARLPCPSSTPRACSNSCPSSQWCHPTISSSIIPFSFCLQSFPASGPFAMSWFFTSGGQSIGDSASASVLPMIFRTYFL